MTEPELPSTSDDQDLHDQMREEYRKYSESLQASNNKTQEELDKTLITLSTVIIGVVLTFRQQIALGSPSLGFPFSFWLALFLLFTCILLVLTSHFLSLRVNERIIDLVYFHEDWSKYGELEQRIGTEHRKTHLVRRANFFSASLFVLGLLAAVFFIVRAATV